MHIYANCIIEVICSYLGYWCLVSFKFVTAKRLTCNAVYLAGGCVDPEEMAEAAEGHLVLKKVLNIVFLVIGSLLFAAVFVVIIYTSVGESLLVILLPFKELFPQ